MLQNMLLDRAQSRIQKEFGWERHEHADGMALFPKDAEEFLSERGLGWIVGDFVDLDRLNELEHTPLASGHYAYAHQLGETDIVAKRYYPFVYTGGHNGDNQLRQVTESSILRDLMVNLALERALEDDETHITPRYLGHMMLKGAGGNSNRHYTLMTKLDILSDREFEGLPEEDKIVDRRLRKTFKDHCMGALRTSDTRVMFAKFDITKHKGNMPALRDAETDGIQPGVIGVIDAETRFKWRRPVEGRLVSYQGTDPHAPWLAVDNSNLSFTEESGYHDSLDPVPLRHVVRRFATRHIGIR